MIFTKILPALFSIVMVLGFALFVNGISGLLARKNYAPVKDNKKNVVFSVIKGEEAFSWGRVCLYSSLPFLITAVVGFYVSMGFANSPAYLIELLEAPAPNDVLYSTKRDGFLEVAYGFNENARIIHSKFKRQLEIDNWKIEDVTPIAIKAVKDDQEVTINLIGFQMGDSRIYPTKAIVILRHIP